MVGTRKLVTLLALSAFLCSLVGLSTPALAQGYDPSLYGSNVASAGDVGLGAKTGYSAPTTDLGYGGMDKYGGANTGMDKGTPSTANMGSNAALGKGDMGYGDMGYSDMGYGDMGYGGAGGAY